MSDITRVAVWASIECEKQRSGEASVGRMVEAWQYVYDWDYGWPDGPEEAIQMLGFMIEPSKNPLIGWRNVNVRVGADVKAHWEDVPALMTELFADWQSESADDWYYRFEQIHPFRDGNGRSGNILWNLHRRSLEPHLLDYPPDFWGFPRLRMPDRYAVEHKEE